MENNIPALWTHQKDEILRSQVMPERGLFWDVGTGKTRACIDIMRHRFSAHSSLLKTLILAPKIVLTNWQREILKYSKIHKWDIVVLSGSGSKRLKQFQDAVLDNLTYSKPKIIITNYESLQMDVLFKAFMTWKPDVMVADEAHYLKNPESKRAKKAIQLADQTTYRYALTGTPVLNSAMDVFNIFRFLDKGDTFGRNFYVFRSNWFEDENASWSGQKNYFPKYRPRPETFEEFNKRIYRKASRAIKSECLDLPPFVRKEVHVELSTEQAKLYNQMKKDYIAFVESLEKGGQPRAVIAQMAVTKALRLQQIITGFAKPEDGEVHKIKDNPRLDALKELLEQHTPNHKIIVWSVFHENYADIRKVCEELKLGYRELHGQISSQKIRDKNIDDFNNDAECRVLIANQAAGGIGINLVSSDLGIWYSKNFSLGHDIQSEGRNYRGGSEKHNSVTRIDIIAPDTIDELISQALLNKQDIATKILDWRKHL
jgi:SNF2 family DNA or RNA helicase